MEFRVDLDTSGKENLEGTTIQSIHTAGQESIPTSFYSVYCLFPAELDLFTKTPASVGVVDSAQVAKGTLVHFELTDRCLSLSSKPQNHG